MDFNYLRASELLTRVCSCKQIEICLTLHSHTHIGAKISCYTPGIRGVLLTDCHFILSACIEKTEQYRTNTPLRTLLIKVRTSGRQSHWNAGVKCQWRIYIVKFWTRPPSPGVQILSISCSFWEILAKSYVGAPSSGKS